MLRATELLTVFVSLETFSLCLYSLAAYHRRLAIATEGALKYFLMGAFVSAFILYGVALVFGATGKTRLEEIGEALGRRRRCRSRWRASASSCSSPASASR